MTAYLDIRPEASTLHLDLEQSDNIYIRQRSKQTDDAWNTLESGVAAWTTSKALEAAGKDPSRSVKLPPSMGLGEDAYPIIVDIKHRIHCLNRLRKDLSFDYYYSKDFPDGNASEFHYLHTNHCILVLLKSMICDANTDFAAYSWFDGYDNPMADFDIGRRCGDFDGIHRWARERQLDQTVVFDLPKPASAYTRPMSPGVREKLSQYDSHGRGGDIN